MVWWDIGGGVEMVGVRYFSGNRKVRQSGKSREVATLHPTTPPGKTQAGHRRHEDKDKFNDKCIKNRKKETLCIGALSGKIQG